MDEQAKSINSDIYSHEHVTTLLEVDVQTIRNMWNKLDLAQKNLLVIARNLIRTIVKGAIDDN